MKELKLQQIKEIFYYYLLNTFVYYEQNELQDLKVISA